MLNNVETGLSEGKYVPDTDHLILSVLQNFVWDGAQLALR